MITKILGRMRKWRNRCRTCGVDLIDVSIIEHFPDLIRVCPVKMGFEYHCARCGNIWFLSSNRKRIKRIQNIDLYQSWKSRDVVPSLQQTEQLRGIGGISDYYNEVLYFPCETVDGNNVRYEKCIILISKVPCAKWPKQELVSLLAPDVVIRPSKYALPIEIRLASMNAPDKAMGYAPICVVSQDGIEYTISAQMHFFRHKNTYGPSLRLKADGKVGKNKVWPDLADHYYLADWVEMNCETNETANPYG